MRYALLETVFRRSPNVAVAGMLGTLTGAAVALHLHSPAALAYTAAVFSLLIVRLLLTHLYHRDEVRGRGGPDWVLGFAAAGIVFASLLGGFAGFAVLLPDPAVCLPVVATTTGIAGAMVAGNATLPRFAAVQAVLALMPITLAALFVPERFHHVLALTNTIYLAAVLVSLRTGYRVAASRLLANDEAMGQVGRDALTGIASRRAFDDRLLVLWRRLAEPAGRFALVLLDVDHFKAFNDHHGHVAGDDCLRRVAHALLAAAPASAMVARYGGEEFAVLLPAADMAAAVAAAHDLCAAVTALAIVHGHREDGHPAVSISAGVAAADGATWGGKDPVALVEQADLALYDAKKGGRDRVCQARPPGGNTPAVMSGIPGPVDRPSGLATVLRAATLATDLRRAMRDDRLQLHYQPIQDLANGTIVAFEALLRWHDPQRGMVPPQEFVAVAESSGFIVELGEWVLRNACREAARWDRPLSVGVNLSPVQFGQPGLGASVAAILAETGLAAERLTLELTEGVLLAATPAVAETVRRIREGGSRFSLDDFGTGFANAAYLRDLPFSSIKIDRSFLVRGDPTQRRAVLSSLLAVGRAFGVKALVEGIETPADLALIREIGFDYVQGYLIGRPMPAEAARLVASHPIQPRARQTA